MIPPIHKTTVPTGFITDAECPPALIGTSLDPAMLDEPVSRKAIEEAMAERKRWERKRLPLKIKSFEC